MRTITRMAVALPAVIAVLSATGPTAAIPLRPAEVTPAYEAPVQVGYYRRPGGAYYFGFGKYYGRGYLDFGYTSPYFGFGFMAPYYSPPYSTPYYAPGYYEPAPYSPQRYYEPVQPQRYYAPAPRLYEAPPNASDPTGRCGPGQRYRYPVGCVPY
jgi:hypothetical protein